MADDSDVIVSRHHVSMTWDRALAILFASMNLLCGWAYYELHEAKEKASIGISTLNLERERLTDRVIKLEGKVETQAEERRLLHDLNDKVTKLGTQFDDYIGAGRRRRNE